MNIPLKCSHTDQVIVKSPACQESVDKSVFGVSENAECSNAVKDGTEVIKPLAESWQECLVAKSLLSTSCTLDDVSCL